MKLDKDEFLKTEFGIELKKTVEALVYIHTIRAKCFDMKDWKDFKYYDNGLYTLFDCLDIFKLALKQFYGIEYDFTITDEYFGLCTEDGSDWLFKTEREIEGKGE